MLPPEMPPEREPQPFFKWWRSLDRTGRTVLLGAAIGIAVLIGANFTSSSNNDQAPAGPQPTFPPATSSLNSLSEALCNDLDDGMLVHQIRPSDYDPEEFAHQVWLAVTAGCPEHKDRSDVATLLQNWGY